MIVISDNTNPNYNGNITQANGFYRAEAYSLSAFDKNTSFPTSMWWYLVPVTFANAGNCKWIVLLAIAEAAVNRPITVILQELVWWTWTDRATKTLTAQEISASTTSAAETFSVWQDFALSSFIRWFRFDTPYPVNTTAGIWRFNVYAWAGTWTWYTSFQNGWFYVAWCDNQVSFTSDQDQFIAMDTIYLNAAVTLRWAVFPWNSNAMSWFVCSWTTRDIEQVSKLMWSIAPTTSYTVICRWQILMWEASWFRAWTTAVPIPISSAWILSFNNPAVWNINNSSSTFFWVWGYQKIGCNLFIYWEIPAVEDTELAVQATSGSTALVTKVATWWNIWDSLRIWWDPTRWAAGVTERFIASIAGVNITLSYPIDYNAYYNSTYNVWASIIRQNWYWFKMDTNSSSWERCKIYWWANFVVSWCQIMNLVFEPTAGQYNKEQVIWTDIEQGFYHCYCMSLTSTVPFLVHDTGLQVWLIPPKKWFTFNHVNFVRLFPFSTLYTTLWQWPFSVKNCIFLNPDFYLNNIAKISWIWEYTDNKHENCKNAFIQLSWVKSSFRRNRFWWQNTWGANWFWAVKVDWGYFITDWWDNFFDNSWVAIELYGTSFYNHSTNDYFWQISPNTIDVYQAAGSLHQLIIDNPKWNLSVSMLDNSILSGSQLRILSENRVANSDRIIQQEWNIVRTWHWLADTKVWTGSTFWVASPWQFWLRLQPYKLTTNIIKFSDNDWTTTIWNSQGKTVTVTARIKVNDVNFFSNPHINPTLRVTYDWWTVVSHVALDTIAPQQLQVLFTPATDRNDITIEIFCATEAVNTFAYVYIWELLVWLWWGISIDTSTFAFWKDALPLGNTRTFKTPASAWDEPTEIYTVDGSYWKEVNKMKKIITLLQ